MMEIDPVIRADFRALSMERGIIGALETLMKRMRDGTYCKDREVVLRVIIALLEQEQPIDAWNVVGLIQRGDPLIADFIMACGYPSHMKKLTATYIVDLIEDHVISDADAIRLINERLYFENVAWSIDNNESAQMFLFNVKDGLDNEAIVAHCDELTNALIADHNAMKRRQALADVRTVKKVRVTN